MWKILYREANRVSGDPVVIAECLSTDEKVTAGIGDGSLVHELDTKDWHKFSTVNTNPSTSDGWWTL